ncbi:hypothetical protein E5A74_20125 [Sphingomonas naasensis]|uniref:Uncharacterized protein n=1 Tax=Sphingomonas naasensis TaxID=1344951 RepID=A0A4S1W9R4_9SPHN|nr:hypothetical protein E5A74_20125 [Sphingomonas naasensis]
MWEREGADFGRRKGEGDGQEPAPPHPSHAFGAGPFLLPQGGEEVSPCLTSPAPPPPRLARAARSCRTAAPRCPPAAPAA